MYSRNERANKAMTDAAAAGVTCFAPGPNSPAKIVARPEGTLMLSVAWNADEAAVLAEVAKWGNLDLTSDTKPHIVIKKWLNENY